MRRAWINNTLWNVLGMGLPFVAALLLTPMVLHGLGVDRYGLLILAWTIVGYFSVFDFGLSRAITQIVARTHPDSADESARVVGVGVALLGVLGVLGGLVLVLGAGPIASRTQVPAALYAETVRCVRILGLGLPFVIVSAGLRGALEGVFDFAGANLVRLVTGIGTYLIPVLVLPFTARLDVICGALVALRLATFIGYLLRSRVFFRWRLRGSIDFPLARKLLGYGGWITVSNLVSPIMAYMDRFLIAGTLAVALVGYYSTSQEVVTKFQIIPGVILSVVFPAISGVYERSPASAADLFRMGSRYVTFLLLPLAAGVVLFAREGLGFWLGAEFAENALAVTQVLAIGSFVNCLALSPFSFLQAVGRPDITAKLHLIELPIYVVLIWQLTTRLGLIGVGLAWSLRMALDLGLLLYVTSRQWAAMQPVTRATGALFVTASAILLPLILVRSPVWKLATLTAISAASAWFLWVEWRVRRAGPGEQGA